MFMYQNRKLHFLHSDTPPQDVWYRYYNQAGKTPDYYNQIEDYEIRSENGDIFVYMCSFISLGGAISNSGEGSKLLHSFCFFDSCTSTAVYCGGNSSIVQDRFCSLNGTIYRDHLVNAIFSYTSLGYDNKNNLNFIVESCITLFGSQYAEFLYPDPVWMERGLCGIFSSNISKNFAEGCSGVYIQQSFGCCVINFTTFENNYGSPCLMLMNGFYHNYLCNFVNNSNKFLISFIIEVIFEKCNFLNADGNGTVFRLELYHAKLTIINHQSDKIQFELNDEDPQAETSFNYSFTIEPHTLHHISTRKCHAINGINNADNQPKQDKLYCYRRLEETFDLFAYLPLYQFFGHIALCIIFEAK